MGKDPDRPLNNAAKKLMKDLSDESVASQYSDLVFVSMKDLYDDGDIPIIRLEHQWGDDHIEVFIPQFDSDEETGEEMSIGYMTNAIPLQGAIDFAADINHLVKTRYVKEGICA